MNEAKILREFLTSAYQYLSAVKNGYSSKGYRDNYTYWYGKCSVKLKGSWWKVPRHIEDLAYNRKNFDRRFEDWKGSLRSPKS